MLSAINSSSGNNACIGTDSLSPLSLQHSSTAKRECPSTEKSERVINPLAVRLNSASILELFFLMTNSRKDGGPSECSAVEGGGGSR